MYLRDSNIEWYALIAVTLIIARITNRYLPNALERNYDPISFTLARPWPVQRLLARRWHLSADCSQAILLFSLFIVANTAVLVLNARNREEVARRCGILATINLALLVAGAHLDIAAAIQGVSLRSQIRVHRWLSSTTLIPATVHVLLVVIDREMAWTSAEVWGLTVSALSIIPFTLGPFDSTLAGYNYFGQCRIRDISMDASIFL